MVQGEVMGKRKIKVVRGVLPVWRLMIIGFLVGILLPNIIWKLEWRQKTLASAYLLAAFEGKNLAEFDYFQYVLRMRGSMFLIMALCGISVFGVPLSVLAALFQGAGIGLILTISILQFGLAGGAMGAGLLLPQYLLYVPAFGYLLSAIYQQSLDIWRNKELFPQRIYRYLFEVFLAGIVYMTGIFLEAYCNPWVFEMFTKNSYFL